jgi:hypothetical protein
MKDAKRTDKRKLNALIKKNLPDLYNDLALNLYNPYKYCQTKNHWILIHSATEYFITKN